MKRARIKRVLADKAYDSYDNFEFLQAKGINPAIPVRKGAIEILKHLRYLVSFLVKKDYIRNVG
ncbi:hypothetical protein DRP04_08900 [Archaeoglobales archaeon]|nr:MAG: hypothetical protein DRP04_08900 [Archaeoglobales archaeon]